MYSTLRSSTGMRIVRIPKSRGRWRTIYLPDLARKITCWQLLPHLYRLYQPYAGDHVHGFLPGRSPVTAAKRHIGYRWSLSADIQDFFDSCTREMVEDILGDDILEIVLEDGAPRQGLPTSPMVANFAARELDAQILRQAQEGGSDGMAGTVYTRYADDITLSGNDMEVLDRWRHILSDVVRSCGFQLAQRKTQVQLARNGRRILLGVGVDDAVYPTRRVKRKLRAARHQHRSHVAHGLEEWCKLKLPRNKAWL